MHTSELKNHCTRLYIEELIASRDKAEAKELQKALVDLGRDLNVDGDIGSITLNAIKQVNNKKLMQTILDNRHRHTRIKAQPDMPTWLTYAYQELGVKECRGKKCSNPRVEQYHDAIGLSWAKDDVPWCAAFIGWAMLRAGYKIPAYPARALSWINFGKSAHKPVLGAIAVKSRKGGGHVTFVVGLSKGGDHIYCLGGNQNDAVNIKRYPIRVFKDFRVPSDYNVSGKRLPIMTGAGGKPKES